jgi:hypothetical protein
MASLNTLGWSAFYKVVLFVAIRIALGWLYVGQLHLLALAVFKHFCLS